MKEARILNVYDNSEKLGVKNIWKYYTLEHLIFMMIQGQQNK